MTFIEHKKPDVLERFLGKGQHGEAAFGRHYLDVLKYCIFPQQEVEITRYNRTEQVLGKHFLKVFGQLLH